MSSDLNEESFLATCCERKVAKMHAVAIQNWRVRLVLDDNNAIGTHTETVHQRSLNFIANLISSQMGKPIFCLICNWPSLEFGMLASTTFQTMTSLIVEHYSNIQTITIYLPGLWWCEEPATALLWWWLLEGDCEWAGIGCCWWSCSPDVEFTQESLPPPPPPFTMAMPDWAKFWLLRNWLMLKELLPVLSNSWWPTPDWIEKVINDS